MSSGESSMANNENSSAASLYDFSALRLSTTLHDDDNHLGDKSSKIISSPLKTAAAAAGNLLILIFIYSGVRIDKRSDNFREFKFLIFVFLRTNFKLSE
ncbi:MAG: hypothetical protein MHMPM18_003078 [Marteilia pararefringens]